MLRSLVQIFIFQFLSMSLFLNLLFETDSYSNEYLRAKIGVDTAENEPLEVWGKIQFIIHSPPFGAGQSGAGRLGENQIP